MVVLYRTSRDTVNEFYNASLSIFKSDRIAVWIVSLLLIPGTLIHELCHYVAAKLLLLRVLSFRILPRRIDKRVQLGEVTYQKADKIRGLIVGIAPVFGGIMILGLLGYNFDRIPQTPFALIISYYLLLSVTTTMYSSREDLKGSFFTLLVVILLCIIIWSYTSLYVQPILLYGLSAINLMLIIAIAAHAIIILVFNVISWSFRQ